MRVPLVLLPGMMCDERLFAPQVLSLSDIADIYVAGITRRRTVDALAGEVLAEVPFERFALGGLSMGGIVALRVVAAAPERVTGLALLDTNHLAETPERQALRQPQINRVCAGDLRGLLIGEMKPNYLGPPHRDNHQILDLVLRMGLELGPGVFENQSLALRDRPDSTDVLRRFKGPALVLCGQFDRLCPVERHQAMRELMPSAELIVVEGAGHLTTLEEPEAVNSALRHWLGRVGEYADSRATNGHPAPVRSVS